MLKGLPGDYLRLYWDSDLSPASTSVRAVPALSSYNLRSSSTEDCFKLSLLGTSRGLMASFGDVEESREGSNDGILFRRPADGVRGLGATGGGTGADLIGGGTAGREPCTGRASELMVGLLNDDPVASELGKEGFLADAGQLGLRNCE